MDYIIYWQHWDFPCNIWLCGQLAVLMGPFMNNVSVAEAMGDMYGKGIRIITSITAIVAKIGFTAIQFQVMGALFSNWLNLESSTLTIVAAIIVLVYTSFGGVRSVTFTDVLQFFTFGLIIPILTLAIWNRMQGPAQQVAATLATNPLFDLKTVVGWNPKFMATLGLLTYFCIPGSMIQSYSSGWPWPEIPNKLSRPLYMPLASSCSVYTSSLDGYSALGRSS